MSRNQQRTLATLLELSRYIRSRQHPAQVPLITTRAHTQYNGTYTLAFKIRSSVTENLKLVSNMKRNVFISIMENRIPMQDCEIQLEKHFKDEG
jgi:hypothetical protein